MFDVFYIGVKPGVCPHERECISIEHACALSRTRFCWVINYLSDYTGWDWLWEPVPWQAHQRHAWPSQWQKDSGTYLIPKQGYTDTNYHNDQIIFRQASVANWVIPTNVGEFDYSWHPDYTDPPLIYQFGTQHQRTGGPKYVVAGATDIKYMDQQRAHTHRVATAIYEIDHLDGLAGKIPNVTRRVRYFDNYLDTLRRLANSIGTEHEFVWVCSSVCDYSNFDFSWHPEQWQATMLHVFASDQEKFGDTFFMHVPTFQLRAVACQLLEWYDLHFVKSTSVPRHPMPVIYHTHDSQVTAVKDAEYTAPLTVFTTIDCPVEKVVTVPLWQKETATIVPLDLGAARIIVPRAAAAYVKTQLYDYPYINRLHNTTYNNTPQLDIVFISNGESHADYNLNKLQWTLEMAGKDGNQVHHIKGVNGRVASQHAAARQAQTNWYFLVPAKLEINAKFDWSWQPDRMQQPKHYIFHAQNPVNGLTYGHQAMVAYNKNLVLATTGQGLDFTLDQLHEVVPIVSGTAFYTDSPWMAWRTAFREVLKLQHGMPNIENEYRLNAWLSSGSDRVLHAEWSQLGAKDAVEYYKEVNGDFAALMKSYEWDWLASYAYIKRQLTE